LHTRIFMKISHVVLDLGHVKQIETGWADKGAAIAETEPFNDRVGQTKVAFRVFIWHDGVEYALTPTLLRLDNPWGSCPGSPYDCVPEPHDYAPS
jgi:hypothetical protein